jgi:eukaryotic-like serine/threonine-protein kinase
LSDLVGRKLKDYNVLRRLGRGAMAEVYLAQQTSLDRPVALKVLDEKLANDPAYVRRFHHEARAAAALVHSSIVQIYEVGETEGVHYIAQEYVPGRNLGEIIHARGAIQPRLALDILRQVAGALVKAHSEGIVHRDIKPENIMLSRSGEVKVADFGLARVQGDGGVNMTQVGITMGTPLYMSPEQIEGGELDSRSDIYSLGVTAYYMLTGAPPFSGDSPLSVAVQHLQQQAEPVANRRPDIPVKFAAIIDRMLAKKPGDRYPDPPALLRDLHQLSADGAAEGWASKPDEWSLADMIMVADDRAEATSRLDDLMKTRIMPRRSRTAERWRAVMFAAGILAGIGFALLMKQPRLLANAAPGKSGYEDRWDQLYHAKKFNTVPAWQGAVELADAADDDFCLNLARMGLAQRLLSTSEYSAALDPLRRLAESPDTLSESFRAFGRAGLVVAYTNLELYEDAAREHSLLGSMRERVEIEAPSFFNGLFREAEDALFLQN